MQHIVDNILTNIKKKLQNPYDIAPWVIAILLMIYLALTVVAGFYFYQAKESSRFFRLAKYLPVPVAIIDHQAVWAREFIEYQDFINTFLQRSQQSVSSDNSRSLRNQVLDIIIQNNLLERAAQKEGIVISGQEVEQAFTSILVTQEGEGPPKEITKEELNNILQELYGADLSNLRKLIQIRLIEDKIRNELLEQVKFRHILVSQEKQAKDLIVQLSDKKKKADFAQLAKKLSRDSQTRDKGGEFDFIARGSFDADLIELEKAIFANDIGLISKPIKTKLGYHVVEILEKRGKVQQSFEGWLSDLQAQSGVHIFLQ